MKPNKYLTTLLNTDVYTLNNGDIYLKVADALHRIGNTSSSVPELKSEADKYIHTT